MAQKPSKRKSKAQRTQRRSSQSMNILPIIGLGVLALIIVIGLGALIGVGVMRTSAQQEPAAHSVALSDDAPSASTRKIGGVTGCQHNPDFSEQLGFERVAIDTSRSRGKGLVLFDIAASDTLAAENIYQHETWDDAGDIGAYTLDGNGNIYVAPFPHVDLFENHPDAQNTVHRIDTTSSQMVEFIALPAARPASTQNPFGIVALTYDCETDSVYAASLMGSNRQEEVGRIYQIDVAQGAIVAQLEGIDAYGLGIFSGPQGKRLYFGRARTGDIVSIALDEVGAFLEQPRHEVSLAEYYSADALIARRITFRAERMRVDGFKFQYNLVPMAEQGPRPSLRFVYDESNDEWHFVEMNRDDF